ncbi:MAG: phosphate ABC transporter permease PstA [Acidimicrobiales bacterium]|nr:phosphate ABC transporter permease PstA [Acidimicrobiales bacterium]
MGATMTRPDRPAPDSAPEPLAQVAVTRAVHVAVVAAALVAGLVLSLLLAGGISVGHMLVFGFAAYLALIYTVTRRLEDRREATNRLMTGVATGAFILVLFPIVSVLWTVIENGAPRFDTTFFTETMRGVVGEGGGGKHAIIGTLIITGVAAAFSVPIGLMVAIYLVEYGRGRLARWVTTMVDVMTGVPSIVAGLFAYSLFVLLTGPGHRSGLAGGVALAVLMTPVVIRTSEEMLRLVPNELREASYALGVTRWRTVVKVVLPTAAAGVLTGITLAIARVIGETAPLLLVAGLAQDTNLNPLEGRMTTLPVMAYYGYQSPGLPPEAGYQRGWTAAFVLVMIVAILFVIARLIAKLLQPKGLR